MCTDLFSSNLYKNVFQLPADICCELFIEFNQAEVHMADCVRDQKILKGPNLGLPTLVSLLFSKMLALCESR